MSEAALKSYVRLHQTSNAIIQDGLDPKLPSTMDCVPNAADFPTAIERTVAPALMQKLEPLPSSPTTRHAVSTSKPSLSSMAKPEDTKDEKSLMFTIMRQQQQMLTSRKDNNHRMNEKETSRLVPCFDLRLTLCFL